MFTYINKQGVQSDQGFTVQRTDRFSAEYREGGRKIVIEVDPGLVGDKPSLYYSRSDFRKWSNIDELLSEADQERIISNFEEALRFQGILPIESHL